MSNRSVPFFRDYLRVLGACVSYNEAARRLNISEAWVYKCLSASKLASNSPDVASVFLFEEEEGDREARWFHDHVRSAVSNSIEAIEAAGRNRALNGVYTTAKFQGKTVWKDDPGLIGMDDATLDMLGYPDRLLRVNGKLVPEQVWTPPSTDLVLGILAAHSKRYRKQSSITMDVNARMSGGVQVIGRTPPPQVSAPLPMIEIVQDEIEEPERAPTDEAEPADFNEIDEPAEPALASEDGDEDDAAPTPAPAPVMIKEPTPPELAPSLNPLITPRNGRPLSDLERDLLSKLPPSLSRKA